MSTYGTATANGPSASREPSGSTTEQAKDKAQQTAQQAAAGAKDRIREQVDQRSTQAGDRVGSAAQDVRSVGEELRRQGKDQPAKLAEQAADRAESLGDYVTRSDGDTILRDVEDFGRRRPWAVIAGGAALGFAASRFLKASSTRRAETPTRSLTAGAPTTRTGLVVPAPAAPPEADRGFGDTGTGLPARDSRLDPPTGPGFVAPGRGL